MAMTGINEYVPRGEQERQNMQVKEVGGPGSGLMLADRGNDRDVLLGVSGVEQGVKAM